GRASDRAGTAAVSAPGRSRCARKSVSGKGERGRRNAGFSRTIRTRTGYSCASCFWSETGFWLFDFLYQTRTAWRVVGDKRLRLRLATARSRKLAHLASV